MRCVISWVLAISVNSTVAYGADWPQWRGPNRDGISVETGFRSQWPASGPKLAWTFDQAGVGYGGPAIVGDTLYLMGSDQDAAKEFVLAIDTTTGKQKWKTSTTIARPMRNFNADWGGGPRSTPTVDGDHVYVLGVHGDLSCLTKSDGQLVWSKSLTKDLGGRCMGIWGYSESPLIDGDHVICSPGYDDKEGQGGIAALDKKSGAVKWQCKELTDQASYSSAVISEGGGVRQYVVMTKAGAAGVRASDGKLLWKTKIGANNIAVIPTPIVSGDLVYITSDYGSGCGTLQLKKDGDGVKAEPLFDNKIMMNHHGGVILRDGAVFGAHGNANQKKTLPMVCQDVKSGKSLWEEKSQLEPSSIVYADGHFYAYGQNTGEVVRFAASPKGFEESGRFKIPKTSDQMKPQGGIWTHPVIADGKLYLRDQELLFCYDLKATVAE